MTCAVACRCRCGQGTCGCHETNTPARRATPSGSLCQCMTPKRRFGTNVDLCPDCDFARCSNEDCRLIVRELSWTVCPHCGTRQ